VCIPPSAEGVEQFGKKFAAKMELNFVGMGAPSANRDARERGPDAANGILNRVTFVAAE
jgi:hypothetical protein